jgi:type I restriction enzyme S subunit
MTHLVIKNLDVLTQSPHGVVRLRQLILDLAVRGQLARQDPEDEPAGFVVEQATAAEAKLVADGAFGRRKSLAVVSEDERTHALPEGWEWVRLGALARVVGGGTPKTSESKYWAAQEDIPWLTPADLSGHREVQITSGARDITQAGLAESSASLLPVGSVLFSSRAPIGYVAIAGKALATNQGFKSLIPLVQGLSPFLYWFLKSAAKSIDSSASGTTFREVSGAKVANIVMPLPPLREQERIVARVEELMGICDELEVLQLAQTFARERLTASALASLLRPERGDDFDTIWATVSEQFDSIVPTAQSVEELRRVIMDLAVRGRLVSQNPNDEPASALLKRIVLEKNGLVSTGALRIQKPLAPIDEAEKPYDLPVGWAWARLGSLGNWGAGTTPPRDNARFYGGSVPWFKSGELVSDFIAESSETITSLALKECSLRLNQPGDVLLAMYGATIGKASILTTMATTNQAVCACTPMGGISSRFMLLRVRALRDFFIGLGAGGAQPNISKVKIITTVVPVPPLEEQVRISDRVDELMGLCDKLQESIAAAVIAQDGAATAIAAAAVKGGGFT